MLKALGALGDKAGRDRNVFAVLNKPYEPAALLRSLRLAVAIVLSTALGTSAIATTPADRSLERFLQTGVPLCMKAPAVQCIDKGFAFVDTNHDGKLSLAEVEAAQAQRVLRAQHRSGLTVKEFTRRAGLPKWKLYAWRQRVHKTPSPTQGAQAAQERTPQPAAFVPLEVLPASGASAELESSCAELVSPGGLRVRLTSQAPACWLPLLCQAMGASC